MAEKSVADESTCSKTQKQKHDENGGRKNRKSTESFLCLPVIKFLHHKLVLCGLIQ